MFGSFLTEQRKVCHHWKNDDETHNVKRVGKEGVFIFSTFLANAINNIKYGKESLLNYLINLFFAIRERDTRCGGDGDVISARRLNSHSKSGRNECAERPVDTHTVPAK